MTVAQPYGFEIDFVRNPISGSTAGFFVIILTFHQISKSNFIKKNFLKKFLKKILEKIYDKNSCEKLEIAL